MSKLTLAYRNFANAPKNSTSYFVILQVLLLWDARGSDQEDCLTLEGWGRYVVPKRQYPTTKIRRALSQKE
jgi:hypothetical protein